MAPLLCSVEVGQAPEGEEAPTDLAENPRLVEDVALGLCRVLPQAYVYLLDGGLRLFNIKFLQP